ncbi:MAG: FHA domain-containing protein [Candidatus Methylacidiphilales bacterium]
MDAVSKHAEVMDLLDVLHRNYMKRFSGTLSFNTRGHSAVLSIMFGDITAVRGKHFEEGGGFHNLLEEGVSDITWSVATDTEPKIAINRSMELILFELAVGMDKKLAQTLEDVRKSGRLPPEIVKTAVVAYNAGTGIDQQIFLLQEGETILGRAEECDVSISDKSMSRRHARIIISKGTAWIEDLGSANGIRVNRKLVKSMSLEEGNLLFLGNTVLRFFWSEFGTGVLFRMSDDDEAKEDQPTSLIPQ